MNNRTCLLSVLLLATIGGSAVASSPSFTAANLVDRDVSAGLEPTLSELAREIDEPVWVAYSVPMIAGDHDLCCHRNDLAGRTRRGGCKLSGGSLSMGGDDEPSTVDGRSLTVLLQMDDGALRDVRSYGSDCPLDAEGLDVFVLDTVDDGDSVAYLTRLVSSETGELSESSLTALVFHAHPDATRALERFARPGSRTELRKNSLFWLAATRAEQSFDILRRAVRDDPDPEVREQAVFAISIAEVAGSEALLIELAGEAEDAGVRGTALFWLGQRAGERVAETLRDALEHDPDAEVKEQAVFALSQLSPERGVPMLIDLAANHRTPEVRQAAMFWLGQSGDPRALDFLEDVLAD